MIWRLVQLNMRLIMLMCEADAERRAYDTVLYIDVVIISEVTKHSAYTLMKGLNLISWHPFSSSEFFVHISMITVPS